MADHQAFDMLDPRLQRQLYAMKWPSLRPIQVETIKAFTRTDHHLVLMAETASGKTEAAFLPVLSAISDEPTGSVRAMYVGPLKALINDQFERIEELCTHLEMPVHRWHGDVSQAHKKRLIREPSGVLLITPESLESLLINRTTHLSRLFGGLRAVVVDELHAFLDGERGRHLASLLLRVGRYKEESSQPARLLGLSATVGDPDAARRYLGAGTPDRVRVIEDQSGESEIQMRVHGYDTSELIAELSDVDPDADLDALEDGALVRAISEDLVDHCRMHSNLIFANRKGDIEVFADEANSICADSGLPRQFLVHHGSLSKEVREDTEHEMKASRAKTTICSSTLEMGIDIGSVRTVGQIGAPWSVASLKQRMGRSGRSANEPRRLRCYIDTTVNPTPGDPLTNIPIELVQLIAVTQLMIDGWTEPPRESTLDLSTLTHQVMSTIAETGAIGAKPLYERLCAAGPFSEVKAGVYASLLRSLARHDLIEQGPDGLLILGLLGESIRKRRDFYAAFVGQVEYTVVHQSQVLGTLPFDALPKRGQFIVFAGRRWQVIDVDPENRSVIVKPSKRRDRPVFIGDGGVVHHRVREMMLQVLRDEHSYVYLDSTSTMALRAAREYCEDQALLDHAILSLGAKASIWMTWSGTLETRTYIAMLQASGIVADDHKVAIRCHCSKSELIDILSHWKERKPDLLTLAEHVVPKVRRKFDEYLSEDLLELGLASELIWVPPRFVH